MIQQRKHQAEEHLHDTDDDRKFHFQWIGERNFVNRQLPDGIETEWIGIAAEATRSHCHIWVGVRIQVKLNDLLEIEVGANADPPRWAEQVHRLGEDIIVDDTRVQAENGHEEDNVAATEEYFKDLIALRRLCHLLLAYNHEQGE